MRQELIDQLLALGNLIDGEGFARGQASGGGVMYTQEQLDQAVSQARAGMKADMLAAYDAAQASESSIESGLRSQLESL
jgi:hypothetical protein